MSDNLPPGQPFEVDRDDVGRWVQHYVNLGAKHVDAREKADNSDRWILTPE
jgi:hypothetical protein